MKKTVWGLLLAAASVMAMAPLPALADRGGYDRGHSQGHGHYGRHSERQWRSGSWHHGAHLGRIGWWWVVNGAWYPYTQRSNAYPVYQETIIIEQPVQPIPQMQQSQPQQQYPQYYPPTYPQTSNSPPNVQQPANNLWYYCDASHMYYPYVQTCTSGWRAVSPVPPSGVMR
jgi:hypothetical protein